MRSIQVKKLTLDNFREYGHFRNLLDEKPLRVKEKTNNDFFPDLLTMKMDQNMLTSISMCYVEKCEKIIDFAEYHRYTEEGLLPMDADCIIYLAKPSNGMDLNALEAFFVPKGTFVSIRPGVVHGRQFVTGSENGHMLIVLPQRTYANDCEIIYLTGEDRILIEE